MDSTKDKKKNKNRKRNNVERATSPHRRTKSRAEELLVEEENIDVNNEQEEKMKKQTPSKPAHDAPLAVRRSPREYNKIRLMGTASTFYRRLQTLFFSPDPSHKGYQDIGGNKIRLKRVYRNPPIYVIDNFLTPSDLEYFNNKINNSLKFQKSYVDNMQQQQQQHDKSSSSSSSSSNRTTLYDNTHRTSTFFGFKKLHDSKIAALEQRIADILGCWVHQIEALQLVRYLPTQFFGVHHDLGDLLDNDEVTLPPKNQYSKRRLVTLFCYLNTLEKNESGGCTYFPKCEHLRVKPVAGRAVLWSNINSTGMPDPRTIHAGEAVEGEGAVKYGLNVWICEE